MGEGQVVASFGLVVVWAVVRVAARRRRAAAMVGGCTGAFGWLGVLGAEVVFLMIWMRDDCGDGGEGG